MDPKCVQFHLPYSIVLVNDFFLLVTDWNKNSNSTSCSCKMRVVSTTAETLGATMTMPQHLTSSLPSREKIYVATARCGTLFAVSGTDQATDLLEISSFFPASIPERGAAGVVTKKKNCWNCKRI